MIGRWREAIRYCFVALVTAIVAAAVAIGGYSVVDTVHARQASAERNTALVRQVSDQSEQLARQSAQIADLNRQVGELIDTIEQNGLQLPPDVHVGASRSSVPPAGTTRSPAGPHAVGGTATSTVPARPGPTPSPTPTPTPLPSPFPSPLLCQILNPLTGGTCP